MQSTITRAGGKKIPSFRVLPVGGFLIRNLTTLHERFPEIVHINVGVSDFYLVSDAALVQEILVTKQKEFIKGRFLQKTKKVFGQGLLTSEGDFHHRQRRLVQPAFHQDRIADYAKVMVAYARRASRNWKEGEVLDIHEEMVKLTMAIVAKCLFDKDIEAESASLSRDLATTIEYFNRLSSPLAGILQRLPTNRKYEKAVARIDAMIYEVIEVRNKAGKDTGDLMCMLFQARDESGARMSKEQLRDEVLILFAAGHETTANALTWTWYLLSQNPDVEAKVHAEVDRFIAMGSLPTAQLVPKLEYLTKVLTESMRLYPPAWILPREPVKDCYVGAYLLPKGANVIVSQYVNHHNPRYFKDPESFVPERWTAEFRNNIPKFAYFPFGGGSRSCVGEPFAWMEGVLLLAVLAREWSLKHVANHKVEMLPSITLRPKYGMKMELRKRA